MHSVRLIPMLLLLCFVAVSRFVEPTVAFADSSNDAPTDRITFPLTPVIAHPQSWVVHQSASATAALQSPVGQATDLPRAELLQTEVLTGTIFANRSDQSIQFFLDGLLYELPPFRSVGVTQQRVLAPLVLYTCRSDIVNVASICSWDPYLVRQNAFYEITHRATVDSPSNVRLQEASTPPAGQAWIQNRTGHREVLLFQDILYEVENTHMLELTLNTDSPSNARGSDTNVAYLRRCLGLGLESVCEWLPTPLSDGIYYALLDQTTPGPVAESASVTISLQPLLMVEDAVMNAATLPAETAPLALGSESVTSDNVTSDNVTSDNVTSDNVTSDNVTSSDENPQPAPDALPIADSSTLNCRIQATALNVRTGPGLNFQVIDQISTAEVSGVEVRGRDRAGTWLAVADPSLAGGWIVNDQRWVSCEGDALSLPVVDDNQALVASVEVPAAAEVPNAPTTQVTAPVTATPVATTSTQCRIQTATLNIRSGPGTEYLIVGQISRADASSGSFVAAGRNNDASWLAVDNPSIPGAWIIGQDNFVACETATATLPVAQVTDGRLAPVAPPPAPVTVASAPTEDPAQEAAIPTADPAAVTVAETPESQPMLTVINAFEHDIRFTLDAAQHGLPDGTPSEYDLNPGQTLTIPIRAGSVRFSASSPFRNSSGNAEVAINPGQALSLMLSFVATADAERWELRY
ncbi:hypothetical protein GC175_10195 [bacterium]|nr:hypothetical protein [bacterium]